MKISLKWLNDYVDIQEFLKNPAPLAEKLTAAGLEVEGYTDLSKPYQNVVLAKVVELARHPNADRLTVCQVDTGEGKLRQIVCGAKNHKQGDYVVAALPGAVLPGDFGIKESKIRDVESKGMLCSEVELGLQKESDGIMILPSTVKVGQSFAEYFGFNDVVMEINVTPNRADCLSHLGLAREVATLLGKTVCTPKNEIKVTSHKTKGAVDVQLRDSAGAPRYSGRLVRNVKVGPSPDWLKQKLRAVDMNSINNVVDVTNFVMLELGQPLHAFDLKTLVGSEVKIERATKNEKFRSLDGTEYTLNENDLTIRDQQKPVALAGVVGGQNSGVSDSTRDVFVESAHFTAETVRKSMRRLGLQTDSAYRFSRGTDVEGVVYARDRACQLLQEICGGEVAQDGIDLYPSPLAQPRIEISAQRVSDRLGYPVTHQELTLILKQIHCQIEEDNGTQLKVCPPTFRGDLQIPEDLIEEVGRLRGYDSIPENFPVLQNPPSPHAAHFELEKLAIDKCQSLGFQQAIHYGFTSSEWQKKVLGDGTEFKEFGLDLPLEPIFIRNPLNEELNVMRSSLMPGLLKTVVQNSRYGNEVGRLFELGFVFSKTKATDERVKAETGYSQKPHLAMAAWGTPTGLWEKTFNCPVVFQLKSAVESFLSQLQIAQFQWQKPKTIPGLFHPAQTVALFCEGRQVGVLGALHPHWQEELKLREQLALVELDFGKVMRGQPRLPKAQPIARFPSVERDFAVVMPKILPVGDVVRELKKAGGPLVRSIEVFDVFSGGQLDEGSKSVAFRMTLQDVQGTLSEEQIQNVNNQVMKSLTEKLKLALR